MPVRIFRGWPIPQGLDQDLAPDFLHSIRNGKANISVFSRGAGEHNTTRFIPDYVELSRQTPTIAVAVAGNKVTLSGTIDRTVSQYVTILLGPRVVVSYAPTELDTINSVATVLAVQITANGIVATALGPVITVNSGAYIVAEVGVQGVQAKEVRRTRSEIQITLWCPSPISRDNIARLIEPTLADTPFLTLADNTVCRFRYHNTLVIDIPEKVLLYRRDLFYDAEYLVIVTDTGYEITSVSKNIRGSEGNLGTAPDNEFVQPTAPQPVPTSTPFVVQ
jgi:hypothetical protein